MKKSSLVTVRYQRMQTYNQYSGGVHNTGQAVEKISTCCGDCSYRFGFRLLATFQGAILFILALQSNNLISKALDGDGFDTTQFSVIMIFVLVAIIFSYIKEMYVARYSNHHHQIVPGFGDLEESTKTNAHYAHGFYQH